MIIGIRPARAVGVEYGRRLLGGCAALRAVFPGALMAAIAGCAYLQPIPATETAVLDPLAASDSPLARHLEQLQGIRDSLEVVPPVVAVVSLADDSGFREGIWDLGAELAGALASTMEGSSRWLVVPREAVAQAVGARKKLRREEQLEVGRLLQADLIVSGVVEGFDMKRVTVGDPLLGGYKSYTGLADLRLRVVRCRDGLDLGEVITAQEEVVRSLGLDLLGRPRAGDIQMMDLGKMEFGSEEFYATPVGEATRLALDELVREVEGLLSPDVQMPVDPAQVMSKRGGEVYINLGSDNGLRGGERFEAFRPASEGVAGDAEPLGVVEVVQVIGQRLSSVSVLRGYESIQVGDRLRLMDRSQSDQDGKVK